jgi:CP family cyanate transporter-like MFS transporter
VVRRWGCNNAFALVAILAASFNVRIGVTEVGPLLDRIRTDTGMSATLAGALGSIPFACMGIFAPLGMRFVLRTSPRRLIASCLLLMIGATVLRALVPNAGLIVAATLPLGIGIAISGVVLPGVIKTHFPQRTGAAMGAYVAALSVGASVTALTIVPLAGALGSWRGAFALSAVPTVLCVPLWLLLPRSSAQAAVGVSDSAAKPRPRFRQILPLAAVFGLQSVVFAAVTNWVAALYHHHGWSLSAASFTTALVSILVIPGALVIPALSDRGDRRMWVFFSAIPAGLGLSGLAFAPTSAPWLWIIMFGIGDGALFALSLTLPQDLAGDERTRAMLTTWTLGLGYLLSGTGPLVVGVLLDLTGGFVLPMALLAAMGLLCGVVALSPSLKPEQPDGVAVVDASSNVVA